MAEASLPLPRLGLRPIPLRLLGDDRLAQLVAGGDQAAFATIFERHRQGLFRYAQSILLSPEDAADALQATMIAAFEALGHEEREIRLKPWLYRIAHNQAISLARRRRNHIPLDAANEQLADPAVEGLAEAGARLRQLVEDLGQLPESQRSALVMRELSGLDYAEIAAALSVASEAAAKQTVYEARLALAEAAEGREMGCEEIRRTISAKDRRRLRSRKLRAHLRACQGCRAFESLIAERRRDLALLAPPLPVTAAAALLSGILGGGGGGSTGGGGLVASVCGAGNGLGASAAAKGAAAALAAAAIGGAAITTQPSTLGGARKAPVTREVKPAQALNADASARQTLRGSSRRAGEHHADGGGRLKLALARPQATRAHEPVGPPSLSQPTGSGPSTAAPGRSPAPTHETQAPAPSEGASHTSAQAERWSDLLAGVQSMVPPGALTPAQQELLDGALASASRSSASLGDALESLSGTLAGFGLRADVTGGLLGR